MKTINSNNETSSINSYNSPSDLLIDSKSDTEELKCNPQLIKSYNILKSVPMGHKEYLYQRVLCKNGITHDYRSQSLPNSLDEKNDTRNVGTDNPSNCDVQSKLLPQHDSPPVSPTHDIWFNTWPERCDKLKIEHSGENTVSNSLSNSNRDTSMDSQLKNGISKKKVTLNEALQHISLAYSPVTKQLHLVEQINDIKPHSKPQEEQCLKKCGHKRTEAGSFSSTISSISDPSPSGSLLDAEERSLQSFDGNGTDLKGKGLGSFFSRNFSSWKLHAKAPNAASNNNITFWRFFGKAASNPQDSPQHHGVVASSTALIQHARPSNLPAKTEEEEQKHREEYKAIIAAAKKREAQNTATRQKLHKLQLQQEEQLAAAARHFQQVVLPNWEAMRNTRKTRDLWWQGLPSSVRGKVWCLAIGNDLNLTSQLYEICLSRAQNRLNSPEPSHPESDIDQEGSMDVIQLDISRTFPHLCIFQEGGPYSDVLHSLLAAYVCYRPDVGYVQGMSYIAAILILNMEQYDAFICFSNLLNQSLHLAAFTLNQTQMQAYYTAYNEIFNYNLPKLYSHFEKSGLTPDLYLLDWIYTIFAKAMPLDIACRVWDVFLRDGDEFIFRTAVGILHLNQDLLMTMDFLHGAQFLTRLPDGMSSEQLFKSIQSVNTSIGKQTFNQILDRCSLAVSET